MANRTVSVALKLLISQYVPNAEKAAQATDRVGKSAQDMAGRQSKAWDHVGKASAVAAIGGAVALGKMVGAAMNFDKAMSGVAAVSNASATEMSALREAALQAGAATVFSASESAQAEAELAKAGVSTSDILSGALTGSLNLAAAGQLDLADAATISAQAMNIWKLKGSDVSHIADVLAAGANKSAADVGQLGDAMRQGGLVAAQMGVGMEDTVAVLSAFADNALIGSDAGTSLKTMLQKLMAPTQQSSEAMEDLGLHAFDAGGNFVGMENFAGQLQTTLGGLTQEQRSQALATIFGSDAIRAANVLFTIGAGGVREYSKAVNDNGAAARMAGKQMDNLAGDLEQLRGSLETALIKGGSGATRVLRDMAQAATSVVNGFSNLPGPVQGGATALLALGTAGAGAMFVFGSIAPRIKAARAELQTMGKAGQMASTAIGRVGKGLAIGGGVLIGLEVAGVAMKKLQDASFGALPGVEGVKSALLSLNVVGDLSAKLPGLGKDMQFLGAQVQRLADPSLGDKAKKLLTNVFTVGQADPAALRDAQQNLKAIDEALTSLVTSGHGEQAALAFREISDAAVKGGASIGQVRDELPGYRDALAGVGNESKLASAGTKDLAAAAAGAGAPVKEVSFATDELGRATRAFTGVARDAKGELVQYSSAADILKTKLLALSGINLSVLDTEISFREALAGVTSSLKDNGRTVDTNTAKGRANASAITSAIKAAQEHAGAITDLSAKTHSNSFAVSVGNAAYRKQVEALWRVAQQSGMTRAQFDLLTGAVKAVPKKAETKTSAPGAAAAKQKMKDVGTAALAIPAVVRSRVSVTDDASGALRGITRELNNVPGHKTIVVEAIRIGTGPGAITGNQEGGKVGGRGIGDTQIRALDPREWVIRPEAVAHYGDAVLSAINSRTWQPARPVAMMSQPAATHAAPISITVNAPPGMDVRALAGEVSRRLGTEAGLLARTG